jgi:transposase
MGPYSMDLRERVAAVIDEGEGSQRQVAKRFRVSVSFVTRLIQRRREAGTLAPKAHGGGRGRPSASPNGYAWRC